MLAVMRESLSETVEATQQPMREGGRMRIDTGFLRTSGRANLNGLPSGASIRPADARPGQYTYDGESVDATLRQMKFGDTFYFGWTADYAGVRELYDGFMGTALQNWQQTVNGVVMRVKKA